MHKDIRWFGGAHPHPLHLVLYNNKIRRSAGRFQVYLHLFFRLVCSKNQPVQMIWPEHYIVFSFTLSASCVVTEVAPVSWF